MSNVPVFLDAPVTLAVERTPYAANGYLLRRVIALLLLLLIAGFYGPLFSLPFSYLPMICMLCGIKDVKWKLQEYSPL